MFIYFWDRETEHQWGRSRKRGRHRIRSRLQAPSCQHGAWRGAWIHGPRDHDLSWSQMLNWLSHPSAQNREVSIQETGFLDHTHDCLWSIASVALTAVYTPSTPKYERLEVVDHSKLKISQQWGIWVAQLVTRLTGSGQDLTVHEFKPHVRLRADSSEPGASFRFCVSFCLNLPCLHSVSCSVSKINKH